LRQRALAWIGENWGDGGPSDSVLREKLSRLGDPLGLPENWKPVFGGFSRLPRDRKRQRGITLRGHDASERRPIGAEENDPPCNQSDGPDCAAAAPKA
jgi:hypothetical protein